MYCALAAFVLIIFILINNYRFTYIVYTVGAHHLRLAGTHYRACLIFNL